jgi:hypothetical protein
MNEPEANPCQTITVDGRQLWATIRRIRMLDGVLLSYSASGNSYVLNFVLPDGEALEQTMEGEAH